MAAEMITPPQTYAQWVSVLDLFKNKSDDESVVVAMKKGTIQWQSGVAERFSQRLVDAVNLRLNNAIDRFQKELNRSRGQERDIVRAILALRKELSFLANAVDLPVIPESDRVRYRQLVSDQADKIQNSLEDSAKSDRTGKLASIIRNNKVNSI